VRIEDAADATQLSRTGDGLVGSLKNGLSVFDMFRPDHPTVTVGEIARHLGVHKSSASRIAATLVASGFLRPAQRSAGFQLGGKLSRLGNIAATDNTIADIAHPIMRALVDDVGETCHVGVLEGRDAVTVALIDGLYSVRMHSWVGKTSPAHWTAMGKILLAGLADSTFDMLYTSEKLPVATPHSLTTKSELKAQLVMIHRHGFALDNEELEIGLRCVAAPIFDRDGRVSASLTIAGSSSRMRLSAIDEYVAKVKSAANKISAALGAPADSSFAHKA
jgi:DNA-binding IclR family transcriptional regulator